MDEDKLRSVALECQRIIQLSADDRGVTIVILRARCKRYRELDEYERFRVQVMLLKERSVSATVGSYGAIRFYPRHLAPVGAFNIAESERVNHGAALVRAMERT